MSVFVSNLDDFINPSQACVNPLVNSKLESSAASNNPSDKRTGKRAIISLANDYTVSEHSGNVVEDAMLSEPNLIKTTKSNQGRKVATVSLNDCLACSGCVTSAEAVLIQEQSYEKLLDVLEGMHSSNNSGVSGEIVEEGEEEETIVVVGISPNSRVSLIHFLLESLPHTTVPPSQSELFLRVSSALKSIGVTYVLDTAAAGDVALVEAREEFIRRYEENSRSETGHNSATRAGIWTQKPSASTANSATSINTFQAAESNDPMSAELVAHPIDVGYIADPSSNTPRLPVLSSHCPGWVCYAEKSQPQCLPYLSTVKSAQQIMGAVVKHTLVCGSSSSSATGETEKEMKSTQRSSRRRVYMVSVQPCFDKKLEASRRDFHHTTGRDASGNPLMPTDSEEVDLVLSTTELWNLLEHVATSSSAPASAEGGQSAGPSDDPAAAVLCYLLTLPPDPPQGRDSFEGLFRSFSVDGMSFVSAVDSNAGSGCYAEYIFKYAANRLFGVDLFGDARTGKGWSLPYKEGRNPDIAEVDLHTCLEALNEDNSARGVEGEEGRIAITDIGTAERRLRFGRAYGFRNIQSVMLKLKRGKCELDFIEVMACPSGCNNGGGQIKIASTTANATADNSLAQRELPSTAKERVRQLEDLFHGKVQQQGGTGIEVRGPDDSPLVRWLYGDGGGTSNSNSYENNSSSSNNDSNCDNGNSDSRFRSGGGGLLSERQRVMILNTRYHAVPKLEAIAPLAAKW